MHLRAEIESGLAIRNSRKPSREENAQLERLISSEDIRRRVREMGRRITRDFQGQTIHLIAVLKGACIFVSDLIREIDLPVTLDFISVSSYGARTKSSGKVYVSQKPENSIAGGNCILVEDVLDTGLTLSYLTAYLRRRRPKNLRIAVLLEKSSRRHRDVRADYAAFRIPGQFVVGYGLDYAEAHRNLPDVYVLNGGGGSSGAVKKRGRKA